MRIRIRRAGRRSNSRCIRLGGVTTCSILVALSLLTRAARTDDKQFDMTVRPFLKSYCIDCHSEGHAEGDIRLDDLGRQFNNRKEAGVWARVLETLAFRAMPLATADTFPTKVESRAVQNWIATNLNHQDIQFEDKSHAEGFGNLVPHDLLFSSEERLRRIDVAARIWRVSPETLRSKLNAAARFNLPTNPFDFDKPHGNFTDFKGKYLLNSIMTEQLTELAMIAAENQTKDGRARAAIEAAIKRGATREEAVQQLLVRQFQNVLRRNPSDAELTRLMNLLKRIDAELGEPFGLQAACAAVLLTPETIFRFEGAGWDSDPDNSSESENGRVRDPAYVQLSNRELADALAYALTDRPPEKDLLVTFSSSDAPVRDTLRQQATILLAVNRYVPDRLLQFFQEYFDYEKANDIFKDTIPKHQHWAPGLVHDLDVLIENVLHADEQVLRTLLTTSQMYVLFYSHKERGNQLSFNLPPDFKKTTRPVRFPKDQRMGVLTHPAWLVAHSGNFDNDPIRRGLWIRKKLLGGNVPDVPITVDAKFPDEPTWTLRKRLHVTEADQCYKCHAKMNPLGLPFERFDHYGRFRFDELDGAVITTGAVLNSGVPELDGEVDSPFEMIEKLAKSEHVEQVFVRHVFRFFMGRNETLGDAMTLQDAHKAYVDSNGSMKTLVVSLLSSDSFLYRAKQSYAAE